MKSQPRSLTDAQTEVLAEKLTIWNETNLTVISGLTTFSSIIFFREPFCALFRPKGDALSKKLSEISTYREGNHQTTFPNLEDFKYNNVKKFLAVIFLKLHLFSNQIQTNVSKVKT